MRISLDADYEQLLGGGELTAEEKLWGSVLSLCLIEASRGDLDALWWLSDRSEESEFLSICRMFDLNANQLCRLMRGKGSARPVVLFGRDTRLPAWGRIAENERDAG